MDIQLAPKQTLDNRGSNCAAGFVKLLEIMESLAPGETLAILSTDPVSQRELNEWAGRAGHTILKTEKTGPFWKREYHFLIRKEANTP
ncbi:MAG: sulfurtransferase TusA family protein [Anaerolineaceae bacterium]|nr:sulfurtransferase TusA family protein [Anaerolineaceae bacterium]